jgi:tryptophan synthase beta chain
MTADINPELYASVPDQYGRFGQYGGKFVAETLMSA